MEKKSIALSAIAILMLGSSAYAGKIITDADLSDIVVTENKQFGFGGWNNDNVDVRIVNVDDFAGNVGEFNTIDGTYTEMGADMSFESDIRDINYSTGAPVVGSTVMGHLHGKDWPVGEPSGIKIINGDTQTSHGKPENCIMTTSYLAYQVTDDETSGTAFLDAFADGLMPKPVICSSPFQTHKRYKINLLPTSVETVDDEGYGKPVDLVFNLDPLDQDTTRYQVLQKVNNYSGKRLDGYKVEVLDENGTVNDALTLSLGEGEGLDEEGNPNPTVNIWGEEDMANMSHGLWGPYEEYQKEVRFDNGFFDFERAYYDVNLTDNNHTISYVGDMLGGNYQELFGNWLPSIWEPMGIFHDDDQNPDTDGVLKAFLGVAPGYTERAWYKSVITYDPATPSVDPAYAWLPATDADLAEWEGEWYEEGPVEDVLNLGLNYIINIGANADIGATFTLRITPHVDTNQTAPSSYNPNYMSRSYEFKAEADFNADGIADILWKNTSDGEFVIWYMNSDGTRSAETNIGGSSSNWVIQDAANFNADGIADILWMDTSSGNVAIWYMNDDGTRSAETVIGGIPKGSWVIQNAADFNADGIADILWRKNGIIAIWYMNGDGTRSAETIIGSTSTSWVIQNSADFNADGIADILFRKGSSVAIWYMNNDGTRSAETVIGATPTSWVIKDSANFNADKIADILWANTLNGDVAVWYMNDDGTRSAETVIGANTTVWDIKAAANFNKDGIADILWRDSSLGDIDIWYTPSVD